MRKGGPSGPPFASVAVGTALGPARADGGRAGTFLFRGRRSSFAASGPLQREAAGPAADRGRAVDRAQTRYAAGGGASGGVPSSVKAGGS